MCYLICYLFIDRLGRSRHMVKHCDDNDTCQLVDKLRELRDIEATLPRENQLVISYHRSDFIGNDSSHCAVVVGSCG